MGIILRIINEFYFTFRLLVRILDEIKNERCFVLIVKVARMRLISDIRLMELLAKGDSWPLRVLMKRYGDMVYRMAARFLCDAVAADDITQEVFIRVWRNAMDYDPTFKLSTWLYRITYNLLVDTARREKIRMDAESDYGRLSRNTEVFVDNVDRDDFKRLFKSAIARLTPAQKAVFCLKEIEGLPQKEIAAITGMSSDSVKSNLYLARKHVRRTLEARRNG